MSKGHGVDLLLESALATGMVFSPSHVLNHVNRAWFIMSLLDGSPRNLEWEVLLTLALRVRSTMSMICLLFTCWKMLLGLDSLCLSHIAFVLTCLLENGYMIILAQTIELDFVAFSLSYIISARLVHHWISPNVVSIWQENKKMITLAQFASLSHLHMDYDLTSPSKNHFDISFHLNTWMV